MDNMHNILRYTYMYIQCTTLKYIIAEVYIYMYTYNVMYMYIHSYMYNK